MKVNIEKINDNTQFKEMCKQTSSSSIDNKSERKRKVWTQNVNEILQNLPKSRKYLILNKEDGLPWEDQKGKYGTYILIYHVLELLEEDKRFAFNRYIENRFSKNQIICTTSTKDKELWNLIGLKSTQNFKRAKFINIRAFTDVEKGFIAISQSYKALANLVTKFEPVDHLYWENGANQSNLSNPSKIPLAISYTIQSNGNQSYDNNSPEIWKNPYVEKRKQSYNPVRLEKKRRDDHLPVISTDKAVLPSVSLDNVTSVHQGNKENNRGPAEKNDVYWILKGTNFTSHPNFSYLYFQLYYYTPPDGLKLPEMIPIQVNPSHIRSTKFSSKSPLFQKGNYSVVISYVHSQNPQSVLFSNSLSYEAYGSNQDEFDFLFNELNIENDNVYPTFDFDEFLNQSSFNGYQNDLSGTKSDQGSNNQQQLNHHFYSLTNQFSSNNDMEDEYLDRLLDEDDEDGGDEDDGDSNRDNKINTATSFPFSMKLTQWHYACTNSDIKLLMNLQQIKSPGVDFVDSFNRTPLYLATYYGHYDIVEQLFGNNIPSSLWPNPNICDNDGVSPLHLACSHGNKKLVDLLLAGGARINCASANGVTPLYCAFARGFETLARYLVDTYFAREFPNNWVLRDSSFYLWLNSLPSINNNNKNKKEKKEDTKLFLNTKQSKNVFLFKSENIENILNNLSQKSLFSVNLESEQVFGGKEECKPFSNNISQVFETHHGYPPNLGHYIANHKFHKNINNNINETQQNTNNNMDINKNIQQNNTTIDLLTMKIENQFNFEKREEISRFTIFLGDAEHIRSNLFNNLTSFDLHLAIFPSVESNPKHSCLGLLLGQTHLLYCSAQALCIHIDMRKFPNKRPLALFPLSSSLLKDPYHQLLFSSSISEWNLSVSLNQASGKRFVSHLLLSLNLQVPLNLEESTLSSFLNKIQRGDNFLPSLHLNESDDPVATFSSLDDLNSFKLGHVTNYAYHKLLLDAFERAFNFKALCERIYGSSHVQDKSTYFR